LTSSARKLISFGGSTWAMPYLTDCYMMLYNKALFRKAGLDPNKPPRTIEQVQALWKKLTLRDSSGKITSLAMLPTYGGPDYVGTYLPVYITMFGGQLASADGKHITANCPQCVQALTWEANYYKTVGVSNVDRFGAYNNPNVGTPQNLFLSGKIAMYISGEWNPKFIQVYGSKHFDYGVVPLPVPASNMRNVAQAGGNMGFIMRRSAHPDEAFKFLLWVQNEGPTVRFASVLNNVPQIKSALTDPHLDPNPYYRTFVHQAGTAQIEIFPNLPVSSEYAAELAAIEDKVIHGKMTPKAGLDKVTHDMQTLLDQKSSGI
jgi:multiple sugar transport system substrate-binding protein